MEIDPFSFHLDEGGYYEDENLHLFIPVLTSGSEDDSEYGQDEWDVDYDGYYESEQASESFISDKDDEEEYLQCQIYSLLEEQFDSSQKRQRVT
jgi:hypothetical protein